MSQASQVPTSDRTSFWERDGVLRRAAARSLGREEFERQEPTLAELGARAADTLDPLAAIADRERPRLVSRDPQGNRIDQIEYHPAYRQLEDYAYRRFRLVGSKYDPELRQRGVAHRVGFLRTLIYGMGESGVLCPVCMTDGVARVLEQSGDDELARSVVPRLCFGEGEPRSTGAMFLTEKAGGSDVGLVETVARQAGDRWLLTGEKWFSSNVDSELILALARPEGAVRGTRGLGLFLVERAEQDGNSFRIERLKDKLGTRSMPTGEVVLTDASATLVGEIDHGFKQMAEMLNLSRLYNAVVSCSAIGRSWLEARSFADQRFAFGKRVVEHPLARETLDQLEAEYAGSLVLVLEAIRAIDAEDAGDESAAHLLRALTPLVKLFTAKVAVSAASEGLEFLGGCGYVEDWPAARILRDAQVLTIWEGTTNILALDLLRVAGREGLAPLFERGRAALAGSNAASLGKARDQAAARLAEAEAGLASIAAGEPPQHARALAFALARGLQSALLLEAAEVEPEGPEGCAARRLAPLTGGPCL
jgi:alkylation response protein AidB-like acyl-CoA dehydrogenase